MHNRCLNCENIPARRSYRYCSNQCQADYQYKAYISNWISGMVDGGKASGTVSGYVKRYLRETNNNKCQQCGWSEVNFFTGIVPLEVDHIDGNHNNNKINNLRLICPNCHSLTSTYKALNKGNGRSWRMPS